MLLDSMATGPKVFLIDSRQFLVEIGALDLRDRVIGARARAYFLVAMG
jgi:hypothetical protein